MNEFNKSLPWLQSDWSLLASYINHKRIPQALLLTGSKGLGKRQLAEYFTQSLLCHSRLTGEIPCGDCQSCQLFKASTHPDYIFIEPEEAGKAIGIAIIRQLTVTLTLKPQFEQHRVVVINQADSLNNASANAFLKFLEEPTERTCVILIAECSAKLPATIISRCQKLSVLVPEREMISNWLQQQGITENNDLLINLSQSSPLLAKHIAEKGLLQLRTECFNHWVQVAYSDATLIEIAEQWQNLDRSELEFLIFWILSWVTDMIKLAYHQASKHRYNPDLTKDLQQLVQKLNLKGLFDYYGFLLLSQQRLTSTQLNKQLIFEEILIQWSDLNNR